MTECVKAGGWVGEVVMSSAHFLYLSYSVNIRSGIFFSLFTVKISISHNAPSPQLELC